MPTDSVPDACCIGRVGFGRLQTNLGLQNYSIEPVTSNFNTYHLLYFYISDTKLFFAINTDQLTRHIPTKSNQNTTPP